MNLRFHVTKFKLFRDKFNNLETSTRKSENQKTKWPFFHNKLKDWMAFSKRRTSNWVTWPRNLPKLKVWTRQLDLFKKESPDLWMKTLQWKVTCKMLKKTSDFQPIRIKRLCKNYSNTREESSKTIQKVNNLSWRFKSFWVRITPWVMR